MAALELLCVPQLGILRRVSDGRYVLQMPKATLTRRLRALVAVVEELSDSTTPANRRQDIFGEP